MQTFQVGDSVKAIGFTDCFGKFSPEVTRLVVTEVKHIPASSIPEYWRVTAVNCDRNAEVSMVEGAERFFAKAGAQ